MNDAPRPRLYCIPATRAPVAAVFRRGPTDWSHVGRWDLEADRYDPGAWIRGRLFPRRSDLSPDGRFLCCFLHKANAVWEHGDAYVTISRLPWLTSLHAFGTCGTWTRGYYFSEDGQSDHPGGALPLPYALRSIPVIQFANERRRGWEEAPDSPPRDDRDAWDTGRNARLRKRQPGGELRLCVESLGRAGGEFGIEQAVDGLRVRYWMETGDDIRPLDDLQWADWSGDGRLLAATRSGRLQTRRVAGSEMDILFEADLSRFEPDPVPAPAWARQW